MDEILNKMDYSNTDVIISPEYTIYWKGQELPKKGVGFFTSSEDVLEALSNVTVHIDEMLVEGDVVAVRWHDSGVHDKGDYMGFKPPHKPFECHGISFYTLKNGIMVKGNIVCDEYEVLAQAAKATKDD